ncbi:MAG: TrmB family transcriptional regulator [Nitrososphaerales archaeon]
MLESVQRCFKEYGISEQESTLYQILLERGPKAAGELAKISRIPRIKTYRILSSLESRGVVKASIAKPMKFFPVPPETVLNNFKQDASSKLDSLNQLGNLLSEFIQSNPRDRIREQPFHFQIMNNESSIVQRAIDLASSTDGIPISIIWNLEEDSDLLAKILSSESRGVRIILPEKSMAKFDLCSNIKRIESNPTAIRYGQVGSYHLMIKHDAEALLIRTKLTNSLWTSDKILVQIFESYFSSVWSKSALSEITKMWSTNESRIVA